MINPKHSEKSSYIKKEGVRYMVNRSQEMEEKTAKQIYGYAGTYYSDKSQGVYRFSFDPDSGKLTEPELFYKAPGAKWISLNGSSMVIPIETEEGAGSCFLELKASGVKMREEILKEQQTPCYILQDGDYVYTANYHDGTVMAYRLEEGKPTLAKRIDNGSGAGCHQILLHEMYLMVPCLKQNRIRLFDKANDFAPAGEITFPDGSGPRHGVFNREHTRFYLVSEWSNELFVFSVCGREFTLKQVMSVLPDEENGESVRFFSGENGKAAAGEPAKGTEKSAESPAGAAIRLTKEEKFLYISVRGLNQIAVFDVGGDRVRAIQHVPSGGDHPRDFILSRDERFVLAAHRFEGGIVSMERDAKSGLIKRVVHRVSMPQGVALILE